MSSEKISDYFPVRAEKFVSLGHGRIPRPNDENSAKKQITKGYDKVSKVFIQNLIA